MYVVVVDTADDDDYVNLHVKNKSIKQKAGRMLMIMCTFNKNIQVAESILLNL